MTKQKQEVKLKCPFCKSERFLRSAIEPPCEVEIYEDGDGIRDEDIGMQETIFKYHCLKCNKEVTKALFF